VRLLEPALTLYAWIAAVLFMAFLFLIARFYEVKSRERTYFRLFLVPAILFLTAGIRYAFAADSWVGDSAADLLLFFGGISALLLGQNLLRLMTGGRR
jgi:hypothetical protein